MKLGVVLVKANINPKWLQRFQEAGISLKSPDEGALELKHIFHALERRKNPYAIRQEIADSGTQVFGKSGEQNISINGLSQELRNAGYFPSGVHIRRRAEKKFNVLVIPFIAGGEESLLPQAASLLKEFFRVCWGYVHVWVNPPQDN